MTFDLNKNRRAVVKLDLLNIIVPCLFHTNYVYGGCCSEKNMRVLSEIVLLHAARC